MWISNDILDTDRAIVNFSEETITWKSGQYDPKSEVEFKKLIERSNNGLPISISNFK